MTRAREIFCCRVGSIGLSTFYRHVAIGNIASVKVGTRLHIAWPELERVIVEGIPRRPRRR